MRRVASFVLAVGFAAVAANLPARSAWGAQGERIPSYDVDLTIEGDGDLSVVEHINYDFGGQSRHGIFRDVQVRYRLDGRYDRVYRVRDVRVSSPTPGTPTDVETATEGRLFRIRIGDPDLTISGVHRYDIAYRLEGVLNHFEDHDELYWTAITSEWPGPVERATVRVHAPATVGKVACFAGPVGSSLDCDEAAHDGPEAVFSHGRLGPHSTVTVVVAIPTGVVPTPVPIRDERWSASRAFALTPVTAGASGGLLAVVLAGVSWVMWRRGRDRRFVGSHVDVALGNVTGQDEPVPLFSRSLTPVEYAPPDGVRPGLVGTLVDETANPLDVTATIVDLAVRGHLRIEEVKTGRRRKPDWRLVRLDGRSDLADYEASLVAGLFKDGDEVLLSDLRRKFATRLRLVQDQLYDAVVGAGWFRTRPDRTRQRWVALGILIALAGIGLTVLAAATTRLGLVPIPVALGGLALAVFARWMPHRTAKGTGMMLRVAGFRRLFDGGEDVRARFAEKANIFSEYLPYAIVFGCTEKWAGVFSGLAAAEVGAVVGGWYVGGPFDLVGFSSSMDDFAVATSGTIVASAPSASGTSGFGGGGFSGGGGGGGGGGSW